MIKQRWSILPKKALGWWSVGLIIAMPILFTIGSTFTNTLYASVQSGKTILADIVARPALALTMLAGMASGFSTFIMGFLVILWQKEKSLLVYTSTVFGALLVLFLIAEIAFPH